MYISPISSMLSSSNYYTSKISGLSDMQSIAKRYEEFKANEADLKAQYAELAKSWKTQSKPAVSETYKPDTALKNSAEGLKAAADALSNSVVTRNEDGTYTVDRDKLESAVSDFVNSYNSVAAQGKASSNSLVKEKVSFMTGTTAYSSKLLAKAGITVDDKEKTLSLDKEALRNAEAPFLNALFNGANSFTARISAKASQIETLSETPKATYQTYSASGIEQWLAAYTSGSSMNMLV